MERLRRTTGAQRFSLIELMVVVAIIAIISAVAIPALIKFRDKRKAKKNGEPAIEEAQAGDGAAAESNVEPAESNVEPAAPKVPTGFPCTVLLFQQSTSLKSSYHRLGFDVFTRFLAKTKGVIEVTAAKQADGLSKVQIPLPQNHLELQDAVIKVTDKESGKDVPVDDGDLHFRPDALVWLAELASQKVYRVEFSYFASGYDRYELVLGSGGRIADVDIAIDTSGLGEMQIPEAGLRPTAETAGAVSWKSKNLVVKAPLIIEIPAQLSPMGRVLLLCRLVAVAVLLFGAGFWYLSDIYRPGCLKGFGWDHFVLLALTFSLFFIVFGVLALTSPLATSHAMGLALILSLPLLMLHVSRIIDKQFAFIWVLPLAIYSLAIVINGVYGGAHKWNVYIGAVVLLVGFLTVSWPSWVSKRKKQLETRIALATDQFAQSRTLYEAMAGPFLELIMAETNGLAIIRNQRFPKQAVQTQERSFTGIRALVDGYLELQGAVSTQAFPTDESAIDRGEQLLTRATRLSKGMKEQLTAATAGISTCEQMLKEAEEKHASKERQRAIEKEKRASEKKKRASERDHSDATCFCCACGCEVPNMKHCQNCGEQLLVKAECSPCGFSLKIPLNLISRKKIDKLIHCPACGDDGFLLAARREANIPDADGEATSKGVGRRH